MSFHIIVTCLSLLWTLLSIGACLLVATAIVTPKWLIGNDLRLPTFTNDSAAILTMPRPSIGLYNRCVLMHHLGIKRDSYSCASYATGIGAPDEEFPVAWQACLIIMGIGGGLLAVTAIAALLSLCLRTVFGKSIFTVCGLVQGIAGILLTVALLVYPVGWGTSLKLQLVLYCGETSAYDPGTCELGWALYAAIAGTLLAYASAVLAAQADRATSRDSIEEEVVSGKRLVCVL